MELVGTANSCDEAIKVAEEQRPDLIVMDWAMPGGGDQATKQITSRLPETRILAVSAHDPTQASYAMGTAGSVGPCSFATVEPNCGHPPAGVGFFGWGPL